MIEKFEMIDLKMRRIDDASDPQVVALVEISDAYLDALYPAESNHAESTESLLSHGAAFFGGYVGAMLQESHHLINQ